MRENVIKKEKGEVQRRNKGRWLVVEVTKSNQVYRYSFKQITYLQFKVDIRYVLGISGKLWYKTTLFVFVDHPKIELPSFINTNNGIKFKNTFYSSRNRKHVSSLSKANIYLKNGSLSQFACDVENPSLSSYLFAENLVIASSHKNNPNFLLHFWISNWNLPLENWLFIQQF